MGSANQTKLEFQDSLVMASHLSSFGTDQRPSSAAFTSTKLQLQEPLATGVCACARVELDVLFN